MNNIRAIFKNVTQELRAEFKNSQCLLLISVGQESHERDRFKATIDLINASFHSCIISLYDSLQRYTMALNSKNEPDDFYQASLMQGDLWLERNKKYYSKLAIPVKITRWDSWLNHPHYLSQKNKLIKLIAEDNLYKETFNNTITYYLDRYVKRLSNPAEFNRERAEKLCFEYVLEECTVLSLWPELNCQFELYPGKHNFAMEETRHRFVFSQYSKILHPIVITFNCRKNIPPQKFIQMITEN